MKKFVVGSLEVFTGAIFFIIVVCAMVVGYESGGGFFGAIVGLVVGGVFAVFSTGIVYILLSINANLIALNEKAK